MDYQHSTAREREYLVAALIEAVKTYSLGVSTFAQNWANAQALRPLNRIQGADND